MISTSTAADSSKSSIKNGSGEGGGEGGGGMLTGGRKKLSGCEKALGEDGEEEVYSMSGGGEEAGDKCESDS